MKLEDILIERNEIHIHSDFERTFMDGALSVPIHPILFSTHIDLDRESAYNCFEQSCRDFIEDAREIAEKSEDEKARTYYKDFTSDPVLEDMFPVRHVDFKNLIRLRMKEPLSAAAHADNTYKNGLVQTLQISTHISLGVEWSQRYRKPYADFPERKLRAYGDCIHYTPANTDAPVFGLFLRAWSVNYLNSVLIQACTQLDKITTDDLVTDIDKRSAPSLTKLLRKV